MKGHVQIIQHGNGEEKVLFSEKNMVLDGMRQSIADVMTFMPSPSSLYGNAGNVVYLEPGVSSVSSYQIQAMTLGSAKDYYDKRDSRFWYSAIEYSATNYQQLPLRPSDYFEMFDCFSGIGYNSWRYYQDQDANILASYNLATPADWEISYAIPPNTENWVDPIEQREETFSEQRKNITKLTYTTGGQVITMKQAVPFVLGRDYHLYINGRSKNSTFDFRVGRGREGIIFEYYNFDTNRFISKTDITDATRHSIRLEDSFNVQDFHFKLAGQEIDQPFYENTEYYVEFNFPTPSYRDEAFTPWELDYENPFVDIISLELCDTAHQILKNSNFLTHQSKLINGNFNFTTRLEESAFVDFRYPRLNKSASYTQGFRNFVGWNQVMPVLGATDPSHPESASGLGFILPGTADFFQGNEFSGMADGAVIYTSSNDITSSGCAAMSHTMSLGDYVRNDYAFPSLTSNSPTNLNAANGQSDNNATFMLALETMVSGEGGSADAQGHLEISLTRKSDNFGYQFSANTTTQSRYNFAPEGIPWVVPYTAETSWVQASVPVQFPADGNRDQYVLEIKGRGRSDGTNGFCYYGIKNLSFGPLEGWRLYSFNSSGVANWQLSSTGYTYTPSSFLFSGLALSAGDNTRFGDEPWGEQIRAENKSTHSNNKFQLSQNFVGLEPTKSYRLAVKGTTAYAQGPALQATLKARTRVYPSGDQNILGGYMVDAPVYSATTHPVSNLNPYSDNAQVDRRTFANFNSLLRDTNVSPRDWGVLATASGTAGNSPTQEDARGDGGSYRLSMDVYNSTPNGSYFMLSSAPNRFFNWDTYTWNALLTGSLPEYRTSTSAGYFLELPSGRNTKDYTHYEYPYDINFTDADLIPHNEQTPNNTGKRGRYKVTAAVYGPNAPEGVTLVNNISLAGEGEGPQVAIWKDLYFDWTAQRWEPPASLTNLSRETPASTDPGLVGTTLPFIAYSDAPITNMCLSGLDRNTEFQLNIIATSGTNMIITQVALTDTALVSHEGKDRWVRDADIFTSEVYADAQYYKYENGVVFKSFEGTDIPNPGDPSSIGTRSRVRNNTPHFVDHLSSVANSFAHGQPMMRVNNFKTTGIKTPWWLRNFTLNDYNLKGGDNFAFGWDVSLTEKNGDPTALIAAEVRHNGIAYHYEFNTLSWVPGSERREKSFPIKQVGVGGTYGDTIGVSSYDDVTQWSHIVTPEIVAPPFGGETKIIASCRIVPDSTSNSDINIKDFRVYKTIKARRTDNTEGVDWADYRVCGSTVLFPEFPNPVDTSLQSKGDPSGPAQLGHFLNRINYFDFSAGFGGIAGSTYSSIQCLGNPMAPSITGEKTMEEAVAMGAYLPSGGLWFKEGSFGTSGLSGLISGTLNTMSVVNSDGYIYQHPHTVTDWQDASAGFITSSYIAPAPSQTGASYQVPTLRYVLLVHKDDWKFLDYYMGGVGALGLNTFDYKKSYSKLGTSLTVSSTGETYTQGSRVPLYNVSDPTRNPVFRLVNKKVAFPPGLHIDYENTDYLTIIWDIDFLE